MAKTTPRTRLSADERRARILESAREVFLSQGLAGARTRQIAEGAGITEAILYRHFESKEEIFEVAVLAPLEQLVTTLLEEGQETDEPPDRRARLERLNERMLRVMVEVLPSLGVALFSDLDRGREFFQQRLSPLLEESGEAANTALSGWAHEDLDAATFMVMLYGLHFALALDAYFREDDLDVPAVAARVADLVDRGMNR